MQAAIISIGTELTLGQTVDTNSAWLAQRLAEIGIETGVHLTLADELAPIERELRRAADSFDIVLITGGLGPTDDDLTRQALARAMGVSLAVDQPSLVQIVEFFAKRGIAMPDANRVQAMIPVGTSAIENTTGTAPGIRARLGRAELFAMPGVPSEMKAMFDRDVRPALAARSGDGIILQTVIRTFGAPESEIGRQVADLMKRGRNPNVGTTAQDAIIGVRINAHGRSREEAKRLLDADAAAVRSRLGKIVFGEGDETLQHSVAKLLWSAGKTVATAESCTGGLIAKQLTDVAGSSRYFLDGVVTYSNEAKVRLLAVPTELLARHGAVSIEVAEFMAASCRTISGSDYALSATGIAGPAGGSAEKPIGLVYLGLATPSSVSGREVRLGDHLMRDQIRDRAAKAALNMLRLELLRDR